MASIHYLIEAHDLNAHLFRVTLTIAKPAKNQILSLPVWIPGSYMVREFSKHLQNLNAKQAKQSIDLQQLDKATWKLACVAGQSVQVTYEVYAFDNSVRTAWLNASRAFFNPTSLCLRVHGQEHQAHSLRLDAIKEIAACAVFTGAKALKVDKKGFGTYGFEDYDALADTPFEIHAGWRGKFKVRGVLHEFVVHGAPPSFDGEKLLSDTKKIVEAELQFWHGEKVKPPFEKYVFMLNVVDDGYGGLEHENSTALICSRRDLPRLEQQSNSEGYITLLGLISHEYFHTWNVKRLKPREFLSYDYSRENYTRMLWFFEGFTSYYDDLLLLRAKLMDDTQYLRLLAKTINQVQQTPGRLVQSAAQASMDAWVKYYRQDENTPNATVSYYTKGALVALCFDLSLRERGTSLDAVMLDLYSSSKAGTAQNKGITEADFKRSLKRLSKYDFSQEMAAWVHSKEDLPLEALLSKHGVSLLVEPTASIPIAQRMGLRITESAGNISIKNVFRGGLAELAGLNAGDEILAVDDWRLQKLEDISLYAAQKKRVKITLVRDKKLLSFNLTLPPAEQAPMSFKLRVKDDTLARAWFSA